MSVCEPGCLCVHLALIPVAGEQGGMRWGFFGASLLRRVTGLAFFCARSLAQKGIVMAAKFPKPVKTPLTAPAAGSFKP
jgi:hypothetical protein